MLPLFPLLPSLKFSEYWHYYCVPRDACRCHKHSNTVTIVLYSVSQVTAHLFLIKPYAIFCSVTTIVLIYKNINFRLAGQSLRIT